MIQSRYKIFGIGLSRTGKKSLTKALNILGFNIVHYPINEALYNELTRGNYKLSILEDYDGITDITVAIYYPHLDNIYPNSKFIYTVRDKNSWLDEMKRHWEEKVDNKSKSDYELKMRIRYFLRASVYGCYEFSAQRMSYVYDTHDRNIKQYFSDKSEKLLELNIINGDGWNKLCPFLELDNPNIDFPFIEYKAQL